MNSQQVADKIIHILDEWKSTEHRLVVGIDGIPGVGKSTIMNLMEGHVDALLVHLDDFLTPINKRIEMIEEKVTPEKFMHGLFDIEDVDKLISAYKANEKEFNSLAYKSGKRQVKKIYDLTKPILVMEGTFMFHPDLFNHLWDKRIYLDGDEEDVKRRRDARTKAMMGDNYISEDDPKSFFFLGLKSIQLYQERYSPKEQANILLKVI